MKKIMVVFGTRPEIVKMYPVIEALKASPDFSCYTVTTAQHREMIDMFLDTFEITPDVDLNLMQSRQTLAGLSARILNAITPVLEREKPDMVLVQGDTTTVMTTALAAAYQQIPVGHVEAGLRTDQFYDPFPEEINRRLTGQLATLHFAPTARSEAALQAENISAAQIFRTGNTVIDAVLKTADKHAEFNYLEQLQLTLNPEDRLIFVTAHRRENWGQPLESICQALLDLCSANSQVKILFPVHKNPVVRETVYPRLGNHPQIVLVEPLDYVPLVDVMRRATLILTDSGGIQEEAPSLGKPVLVMRRTTERPEGVEGGTAKLVGTDTHAIVNAVEQLLNNPKAYQTMAQAINPYGDGRAAERIIESLRYYYGLSDSPPKPFQPHD